MWTWMQENQAAIQIVVSLVTTIVWIAYLHLFVISFLRQTRSGLLINRAGREGMAARCIVSNLGSEPAYLTDVLAEIELDDETYTASVIDRLEMLEDGETEVIAQGPMASGAYVDIGSFDDIFRRIHSRLGGLETRARICRIKLIAVAATSQARDLVAAYRTFDLRGSGNEVVLLPVEVEAPQVRTWFMRRRLTKLLRAIQRGERLESPPTDQLFARRPRRPVRTS